ncbi:response regulator transcription factor [Pseudoteredinibacter isoporae]|uniref:DNA-binding NarL/FixJ family response regulator n=1 Tax=Pseudoteredinibacter isoporae TaxID=570281 RepID=A0A7X0MXN7_9GAMM|nr:response regulator transcription factor [Pseudoteredinibacter isoporae]MBB6523668.1 DNA-binding NarL/FixJ family response regulator [Pseudoteredinibacter isoporae]NHO89172.1 response regulator transcription factor [Pseudoteredinibacter isoporae]NIB22217.1 response regulator transcription factor [Pseudoteredinibacter isoporae]
MNIEQCLVVEDELLFQELMASYLLQALPQAKPAKFASNLDEATKHILTSEFQLAIIDISLPDGRGCELIPILKEHCDNVLCVVVTMADDEDTVFECLQMGADGYLLKNEPGSVLIDKLQDIVDGAPPISGDISKKILQHFRQLDKKQKNPELNPDLTPREAEILTLISKGLNRTDIAQLLELSRYTIADHIKSIYRKLGISSRAEATRIAIELGLE